MQRRHDRGDALAQEVLGVGVLLEGHKMRVVVDETGGDDLTARVDDVRGVRRVQIGGHRHDPVATDGDVRADARRARAVDDRSPGDQPVVARRLRAHAHARRPTHSQGQETGESDRRTGSHHSALRMKRPVRRPPGPSFTCTRATPWANRARYV